MDHNNLYHLHDAGPEELNPEGDTYPDLSQTSSMSSDPAAALQGGDLYHANAGFDTGFNALPLAQSELALPSHYITNLRSTQHHGASPEGLLDNGSLSTSSQNQPHGGDIGGLAFQAAATPMPKSTPSSMSNLSLVDPAFDRESSGTSVIEPGAIYLEENGRTYHRYKDGKYFLPNDPAEQDRLDLQHACFVQMTRGKLALAPIDSPGNVMDIATGTGIWANEFARENPSSHVVGTDLSAIQPDVGNHPPNCNFVVDDAEADWVGFPKFDYVHLRMVCSCFNDHKVVVSRIFENLNPGGWVEYQELDIDFQQDNPDFEGTSVQRWSQSITRGTAAMGRDLLVLRKYKEYLHEAGFVDIQEHVVKVPIGPWMNETWLQELGKYMRRNLLDASRGVWKMLRANGMSADDIDALVADMKRETQDERNHSFGRGYFIWARKPLEGEVATKKDELIT